MSQRRSPYTAEHTIFVRPRKGGWYAKCTCGKTYPWRESRDAAMQDERHHREEEA